MPASWLQVVQRGRTEERHAVAGRLQADPVLLWPFADQPPRPERAQEQKPGQPGGRALHLHGVSACLLEMNGVEGVPRYQTVLCLLLVGRRQALARQ